MTRASGIGSRSRFALSAAPLNVGFLFFLNRVLLVGLVCLPAFCADEHEECRQQIKLLRERLELVEAKLQALTPEREPVVVAAAPQTLAARREVTPPELLPELGKIGAEAGIVLNGSSNPFHLNAGQDAAAFIDLPLVDKPDWLHGKISYELMVGLSQSKTTFQTTSNVAQVANLAVLSALNPNGGLQNVSDAAAGTGAAPFPVTSLTETRMKLLQVVPFAFKYTNTAFGRFRVRPYAVLGFGAYVTIHDQNPANLGIRTDASLPPAAMQLVNQFFGGKAPFGGPLVAGQISQSQELEARGLPGGHGNIDFGMHTGAGVEFRVNRSFSLGFDARYNRIAGAPGSLVTYGTTLGVHF
jgi:hypothetical protein